MKTLKNEWLQLLLLAVPFGAAVLLWDKLPARMPVHWNLRGDVDGYGSKAMGVLFLPVLSVLVAVLTVWLPRLDPKCAHYDAETKASIAGFFKIARLAFAAFFAVVTSVILLVALQYPLEITRFVAGGLGLLLAVLGNSMGKLRPNSFAGFRTPWSLASRTVWIKTHRLGGWLMVCGGVMVCVASLLLPARLCFLAGVLPLAALVAVVPLVYSYFCFQAEKRAAGMAH